MSVCPVLVLIVFIHLSIQITEPADLDTTTPSLKEYGTTPQSTTNNDEPEKKEYVPKPILVKFIQLENGGLRCIASGDNLTRIRLFGVDLDLVLSSQDVGGYHNVIKIKHDTRHIDLENNILKEYSGQWVNCAMRFHKYGQNHYWEMSTDYIYINDTEPYAPNAVKNVVSAKKYGQGEISANTNKTNSDKVIIITITVVACLLVLVLVFVLLYKRLRKRNTKATPISEELTDEMDEKNQKSPEVVKDNVYQYVPLPKVPFSQARKMVAANLKNKVSAQPPPLPARPSLYKQDSITEEEEYVYAYGVKQ